MKPFHLIGAREERDHGRAVALDHLLERALILLVHRAMTGPSGLSIDRCRALEVCAGARFERRDGKDLPVSAGGKPNGHRCKRRLER